jgi:hypothetical protein
MTIYGHEFNVLHWILHNFEKSQLELKFLHCIFRNQD